MKLAFGAVILLAAVACGAVTPAPAVGSPLTISELKFTVIDSVGAPVFCDPDFYPIARVGGEEASAIATYPQIKADPEVYAAIVEHEHLPAGDLTDAQKLTLYRAWKALRALILTPSGMDYSFDYRIKDASGKHFMVNGTIRVGGVITVGSRTASGPPPCPICFAAGTLIATPNGPVRVTEIRPGMLVWTETADGVRTAAPVVEVGSVLVPAGHVMVHLVLADGRELLASPGHRTADGRQLGTLAAGEQLDGSTITRWELIPYAGDRTYDLLPAGPTGHYWANGILLASTLSS
ncbi:MAG: Hint domain-containing protein [Candidatus Dormiibacterota bacterium]